MTFEPEPILIVDTPEQLKAFTDPLRIRVLASLAYAAATNQQLAVSLGEPQPNVLYHLRFLLKVGLIVLTDTRIKGGNVEKYYRAVARTFDLRPGTEFHNAISGAEFGALAQEMAASAALWPESPPLFVIRPRRIAPERAAEFYARLFAFISENWDDPRQPAVGGSESSEPLFLCAAAVFRARANSAGREEQADAGSDALAAAANSGAAADPH